MEYSQNLWIFATLLFGIIVVPGMDMIFVLANALSGGTRAGLAAILGIMGGGIVHTITGTLGVTMLTVLIPQLFLPMLLIGAAYMIWVGIGLMRSSITVDRVDGATTTGARSTLFTVTKAVVESEPRSSSVTVTPIEYTSELVPVGLSSRYWWLAL